MELFDWVYMYIHACEISGVNLSKSNLENEDWLICTFDKNGKERNFWENYRTMVVFVGTF